MSAGSSHGNTNRGLLDAAAPNAGFGRFGRMFNVMGPVFSAYALEAIAKVMIKADAGAPITEDEVEDENPVTPAAYTYFGQFVDHDLTFDPTPLRHQTVDVPAMVDFRTPALDLDCVYGRGPDDQPYLYTGSGRNKGIELRNGATLRSPRAQVATLNDVLRLADAHTPLEHPAVLGDKRNDENKIVTQLQSVFIALHNKLLRDDATLARFGDDLDSPNARFQAAARAARWHYQWVVIHDMLGAHLCDPAVFASVWNGGEQPRIDHYLAPRSDYAYIPIEFSGAAYRLGHSMIRPSYALNSVAIRGVEPQDPRIPTFSKSRHPRANLNGFGVPMPEDWGIDWAFFLAGLDTNAQVPGQPGFKIPQPSYRLDALLAEPLQALPEFEDASPSLMANLAYRNLVRGNSLQLPTGEQVARLLGFEPLSAEVLWSAGAATVNVPPGHLRVVAEHRRKVFDSYKVDLEGRTPLWYYVLREAEYLGVNRSQQDAALGFGGQHLGPVGSYIVAETLVGLLVRDPESFLYASAKFAPVLPRARPEEFSLSDLVRYALS